MGRKEISIGEGFIKWSAMNQMDGVPVLSIV